MLKYLLSAGLIITILIGGYFYFKPSLFQNTQPQKYTGPVEKVTFSSSPGVKSSAVYIAKSKGYFQEEGLDINIAEIPSAKQAFLNMLDGQGVDISAVADPPVVISSFERKDFYVFATISEGHDDKVIARKDKGITGVTDLKGKKVGITGKGTSSHFFLSTLLTFNGLAEKDVKIVVLEPEKLLLAIEDGTLDAVSLFEPNGAKVAQLLGDKATVFSNQGIYKKTFNLMVRKDFAQNHPETLIRFLRAIDKANKFIAESKEESQILVADRLKLDRKEITTTWDENSKTLSLNQSLLLTLEDEARWAIKNKLTDKTKVPDYLNFIYFDALEAVKPEAVTVIH